MNKKLMIAFGMAMLMVAGRSHTITAAGTVGLVTDGVRVRIIIITTMAVTGVVAGAGSGRVS